MQKEEQIKYCELPRYELNAVAQPVLPTKGPYVNSQKCAWEQFAVDIEVLLNDPTLCGRWVVYRGGERLPESEDSRQVLYHRCITELGLKPGQFRIFQVIAGVEREATLVL
jgi:hypothetical protein